MSDDEAAINAPISAAPIKAIPEVRTRYKSWRKKYRKMKARFDDIMRYNGTMFKEEQKLEALAKRLQEQNDQLLDLLLDLNSSLEVPASLRCNIKYREDWAASQGLDLPGANRMLYDAYEAGEQGRMPRPQFDQMKDTLEEHIAAKQARPLSDLERKVPHPKYDTANEDLLQHIDELADPIAFMNSTHEEEYLSRLDAKSGDPLVAATGTVRAPTPPSFATMTPRELDREVELRNPLSVHNWLKKHHINIGEDATSEGGGTSTAAKKARGRNLAKKVGDRAVESARERDDGSPMSSVARGEGDEPDEDVGYDDMPSRGRRSRDDDGAYRPKGGRSGKPKRKREDGTPGGSSKKPKTSLGGAGDA